MKISRRQVLGGLGGLGLFVTLPALRARAGSTGFDGPYLITVHAGGGWDPTTSFDGKVGNEFVG